LAGKDTTEVMKPGSTRTLSEAGATAATRTLPKSMSTRNRNDKKTITGRQQQQGHQKLQDFSTVKT
jgi:hypothetical protein